MSELVVLPFQKVMQRQGLRIAVGSGAVGGKPSLDDIGTAGNPRQLLLELRRLPAIGMAQPPVAGREGEDASSRLTRLRAGLLHRYAQHLAIASRRNRQPMFKIPAGEAAFASIVAQFDLAVLQRLAIGRSEDRQQHAAALA